MVSGNEKYSKWAGFMEAREGGGDSKLTLGLRTY